MKRTPENVVTRVYQYGFYPEDIPDAVSQQLRLANDFWNALVAYEHTIDERSQQVWRTIPALDALYAQLDALDTRYSHASVKERAAINQTRAALHAEAAALKKVHNSAVIEQFRAFWQTIHQERPVTVKQLRQRYAAQGLYFGTYNDVITRYDKARGSVQRRRSQGLPARLHFQRFDGAGSLTLQIVQTADRPPLTMELLESTQAHSYRQQIHLDAIPRLDAETPRAERRKASRTRVMVRMGTTPDHGPLWLHGRIIWHRHWPPGGAVKSVRWVHQRIGTHFRDYLQFTVRLPASPPAAPASAATIAFDLGWRRDALGLRVATWASTLGEKDSTATLTSVAEIQDWPGTCQGTLVLPQSLIDRLQRIEHLSAVRKDHLQELLTKLGEWTKWHPWPQDFLSTTDEAKSQTWRPETWSQRGNERSLAALALHWRTHRFPGDEMMYQVVETWRKQDKQLLETQSHLRDKTLRYRRELYRVFAARVATLYGQILVGDIPLDRIARGDPEPEISRAQSDAAQRQRHWAAVYSLREALEQTGIKHQAPVLRANSEPRARRCPTCRTEDASGQFASAIIVTCPHCGLAYDQDVNTAQNLLQSAAHENLPNGATKIQ